MTYLVTVSLNCKRQQVKSENTLLEDFKNQGFENVYIIDYEIENDYDNQYDSYTNKCNYYSNKNKKVSSNNISTIMEARFKETKEEIELCCMFIKYVQQIRMTIENVVNEMNNKILYTSLFSDKCGHEKHGKDKKVIERRNRSYSETDYYILKNIKKIWTKMNINLKSEKPVISNKVPSYEEYLKALDNNEKKN